MEACAMIVWFMVGTHEPAPMHPYKTTLGEALLYAQTSPDPTSAELDDGAPVKFKIAYPVIQPCKD